jgi:hypothetical protein
MYQHKNELHMLGMTLKLEIKIQKNDCVGIQKWSNMDSFPASMGWQEGSSEAYYRTNIQGIQKMGAGIPSTEYPSLIISIL